MTYVGSRHDEIAAMLYGPGEPQPQRLPGAQSLSAHDFGRGDENARGACRGSVLSPQERHPRPRPETLRRTG